MANLITRIIRKVIPQQEQRCPACKRTLQSAIDDQLKDGQGCPLEHCRFKDEIRQAILESKTPEVVLWNIDKIAIFENETITLSWEVLYAKKISISGLGEVPLKGNRTISPVRDTTYTLTIEDWKNNEVEQKISVKVTPLPVVVFQSDKTRLEIGDIVTFSWTARYTSKVEISDGNLMTDVTNRTDYLMQLTKGATCKLIATALDSKTTIEKEIAIEVFPKPEIKYFTVLPEAVIASQPVTLSWKVENAKKVEISNGGGEVAAEGSKILLHDKNTLYTLTAVGELSTVTKNIVVTVFPTPIIESLLVPMPDFESRISLSPIKIEAPIIDVKINMPNFNLTPLHFTTPEVELESIKPLYKKKSIFNFSYIYDYVRRTIKEEA